MPSQQATPETYLGTARAEGWLKAPLPGRHDYGPPPQDDLALNEFAYSGVWTIGAQAASAVSGARVDVEFQARDVYLVLSSAGGRQRALQVMLDGRPIPAADAGADVRAASAQVTRQRLYTLVSLPRVGRHHLALRFSPGISGYAFTFG